MSVRGSYFCQRVKSFNFWQIAKMSLVCFTLCQVANKNAAGRENPVQFFAIFKTNITTEPQVRGKPTVFRVFDFYLHFFCF